MPNHDVAQLTSLLDNPREELDMEIKRWLDLTDNAHKATLAKAIIAIANHGGGYVIIGFDEQDDGSFIPCNNHPENLNKFTQDGVNGIVASYADPVFHCHVHHVKKSNFRYPIIVIPGDHKTPIQANKGSPDQSTLIKGKYYIRRQGPQSAEPSNSEEWRALISRCIRNNRDELLDAMRDVLAGRSPDSGNPIELLKKDELVEWQDKSIARWNDIISNLPDDAPPCLGHGYYLISYSILDDFVVPSIFDFKQALESSVARYTGWPPWWVPTREGIAPRPVNNVIECSLGHDNEGAFSDPAHSDFWRASPSGLMFLMRGYDEDSIPDRIEAGKGFDIILPTWRIGEALLHAQKLASQLGVAESDILFRVKWSGLNGRELVSIGGGRNLYENNNICLQDNFESEITVAAHLIDERLPEIVLSLLSPLYETFNFYHLPRELVEEELRKLRTRGF